MRLVWRRLAWMLGKSQKVVMNFLTFQSTEMDRRKSLLKENQ